MLESLISTRDVLVHRILLIQNSILVHMTPSYRTAYLVKNRLRLVGSTIISLHQMLRSHIIINIVRESADNIVNCQLNLLNLSFLLGLAASSGILADPSFPLLYQCIVCSA